MKNAATGPGAPRRASVSSGPHASSGIETAGGAGLTLWSERTRVGHLSAGGSLQRKTEVPLVSRVRNALSDGPATGDSFGKSKALSPVPKWCAVCYGARDETSTEGAGAASRLQMPSHGFWAGPAPRRCDDIQRRTN